MTDMAALRDEMVRAQIAGRGVEDARVLEAMRVVPRELFVATSDVAAAYDDCAMPIGFGQTISQPYVVAAMIAALRLRGGERVLEVGAGSGYAAAVVSCIAKKVFGVERVAGLAERACENLSAAGITNVEFRCGDGTDGWQDHAPFDAILVSAGGEKVPQPLLQQLKTGGRLVMPVGSDPGFQMLTLVERVDETEFTERPFGDVRFVPLVAG